MKTSLFIVVTITVILCFTALFLFNASRKSTRKTDSLSVEWNRMLRNYLTFPLDHHYGSHAIVLLAAAFITETGAMLELGMGSTSTPLLSRISREQKRRLISADSDLRWLNYFLPLTVNNSLHQMKHVEVRTEMGVEWALANLSDIEHWSLVLIDHRPGPRRQFDLIFYSHRSDLVILHDTEKSSMYRYDEGLKHYRYRYRFTGLKTFTDVLSSEKDQLVDRIRYLLESTPKSVFTNGTLNELF